MTDTLATRATTTGQGRLLLAGLAGSAIVIALGNWNVPPGENGGAGPALASAVLCVVAAGLAFGVVLPRSHRVARVTAILGATTLLSLPVFWSGVTPVLASATLAAARDAGTGDGTRVWRVLAIAAAALVIVWSAVSQLAPR